MQEVFIKSDALKYLYWGLKQQFLQLYWNSFYGEGGRVTKTFFWSPNRSEKSLVQCLNREVHLITVNPIKLIFLIKGWSDQLQKAIEDIMNSEFN